MSRRDDRRKEIEAVREHARNAVREGKSINSCPYRHCDEIQWKEEFRRYSERIALKEAQNTVNTLRTQILEATTIEDLQSCLLGMLSEFSKEK